MKGLFSIGSGTGVLEWLIKNNDQGLVVQCSERKESLESGCQCIWGSSLIETRFVSPTDGPEATIPVPKELALFQCYGNGPQVLPAYLKEYQGDVVIVIGQLLGTRPSPDFMKTNDDWKTEKLGVPYCEAYYSVRKRS